MTLFGIKLFLFSNQTERIKLFEQIEIRKVRVMLSIQEEKSIKQQFIFKVKLSTLFP